MRSNVLTFPRHFVRPEPVSILPVMPSLTCMVITLQREHFHKLTFRERARLFRATYIVMQGDDADPQTQVEHMRQVHPIWLRMTAPPESAA
jgi:hypothetical protein